MSTSNITYRVEMRDLDGNAGVWANVTVDVIAPKGMNWRRGARQNDPITRLAADGSFEFYMNNGAGTGGNSGNKQGYYSLSNANCRTGFKQGTPVRVIGTLDGVDYPQWAGWCYRVVPRTGRYREQYTYILARDSMAVFADTQSPSIAPQFAKTEVDLLNAVLGSLATSSQPFATSFDSPLDTYTYAFYEDSGSDVIAFTQMDKAMQSAQGRLFVKGDGTLRYDNRHTIALKTSSGTFNDEMHDLDAPTQMDNVYNRVHTKIAPPRVDAASTTEVAKTLSRVEVPPGQSVTTWIDYQDPTNTLRAIGATAFVDGAGTTIPAATATPLVAADLTATANQDGTGADLSANLSVTVTCFAGTAMFVLSNSNATQTLWATARVRGKGIYDDTEQIYEKYVAMDYGDRLLDVDMHYQTDGTIAQAYAEYLFSLTSSLTNQGGPFTLIARETAAKALHGVQREIGDVITVLETVSGVNADFVIVAITCTVTEGPWPIYQWLLAPTFGKVFIFDDSANGVFDASRLAYA